MIFSFFGTSVALLEAELSPFKDWAQKSSSSSPVWRILKCCLFLPNLKTGITQLPEGLKRFQKKGKSSEFNPLNYEQVKSSPSLKVWSHKNVKDTVNLPKKFDFGAKKLFF